VSTTIDDQLEHMRGEAGGRAMGSQGPYMTEDEVAKDIEMFKRSYARVWKKYGDKINKYAAQYKIDPNLVAAVIAKESSGRSDAVGPETRYGTAKGLMQMIDSTAKSMGVTDAFDVDQNIRGGTKYLSMMLKKYEGDRQKALAAYNCGPGCVDQFLTGKRTKLPRETRKYVPVVEGVMKPKELDLTEQEMFPITEPSDVQFKPIDPLKDIKVEEVPSE
jgi:soluble lytic murein transglycosylase-like protein